MLPYRTLSPRLSPTKFKRLVMPLCVCVFCNLKEHCPGIIGSAVILTHMLESNWSGGFGSFNCFLFVVFCLSFVFFTIFLAFLSIGCVLACACHTMQLILSRVVCFFNVFTVYTGVMSGACFCLHMYILR